MKLFLNFILISLTTSIPILFLLALSPVLTKKYLFTWKKVLWICIIIRLLLPFPFPLGHPVVEIPIREFQWENDSEISVLDPSHSIPPSLGSPQSEVQSMVNPSSFIDYAFIIWFAGCLIFLLYHVTAYILFCRKYKKFRQQDPCLTELVKAEASYIPLKKIPDAYVCDGLLSPCIMGVFQKKLLLPAYSYTGEELHYIINHEFTHLRHYDILYKFVLVLTNSIHWFNPFVWLMCHAADEDLELACDDAVIKNSSIQERKAYSETIFKGITRQHTKARIFTSNFYGGKLSIKKRFRNIFNLKKKKNGFFFMIILLLLLAGGGLAALKNFNDRNTPAIKQEDPAPSPILESQLENKESQPTYSIIEDHTFSVCEGSAGDSIIRMMIGRSGTKLTAYYVTQQDNEKEITLYGNFDNETGTFTLSNTEQNIIFDGYTRTTQTEGDRLEGNGSFDGNSMNFSLVLTHRFVQTENHDKLYENEETMGFNTAKVEALAELIKKYVNGDEKEKLAEVIDYPVNINIRDSHFLINDKEEFIQRYDDIFDSAFKNKIVTAFSKYMFANYMGVSFAEGSIIIYQYEEGGPPKIIAISNGATYWDPDHPAITKG